MTTVLVICGSRYEFSFVRRLQYVVVDDIDFFCRGYVFGVF